jgi:hypothetical protein
MNAREWTKIQIWDRISVPQARHPCPATQQTLPTNSLWLAAAIVLLHFLPDICGEIEDGICIFVKINSR